MWLEIVIILLIAYLSWKSFSKPPNYPPGYWGLPLVGYIPFKSKKSLTEHLLEIRKNNNNTPVVSWRMGTKLVVFLFDSALIKEAFTGKDFLNRPRMRILAFNGFNMDSDLTEATNNGETWHATRRFTLHHLRDLGMGKSSLIPIIQKEAEVLIKDLESVAGKPSSIPRSIQVATLNIIWQMLASKRFAPEDKEFRHFLHMVSQFETQIDKITLVDFMPWIPYVVPRFLLKKVVNEDLFKKHADDMRQMLEGVVLQHKETLDMDNPRDFIDEYIIEMEKEKPYFTMENLLVTIGGLFRAATDTTTTTFKWIVFYLIKYPEVQERLRNEVDAALPKDTLATHEDKPRLPYTEAVINEVIRHSCFIKFGIMHQATKKTKLGGYDIPEGAVVCPSLFWVHFDKKYWDSPLEFRPERFLDGNGKFCPPKEGLYPFGVGKRQCIGESLARMALFIFLVTAIQKLKFEACPGQPFDLNPLPISFANVPKVSQEIFITAR